MAIKELREKQAKLVADARAKLAEIKDDTTEARAKEIETEYDAIMADHDKLEERAKRETKLEAAENALEAGDDRRPNGEDRQAAPTDEQAKAEVEKRQAAFKSYLHYGIEGMTPEERSIMRGTRVQGFEGRAQSTSATEGGYTIPVTLADELVKSLKAWGPMLDPGVTRQIVTATGNQINYPTNNDTANVGVRLDENTQATSEGDLVFGTKQLNAYKYSSGPILVSSELLQDSAFNVEQIIRDAMAERIGRKVNLDLTTGDGTGDPNGIATASTLGVTAAAQAAVTFDELLDLVHSIDPAYRVDPSVGWQFNDSTLKALRKMKDGDGNYIWQPANVQTGAPSSLLGYSYSINQAMGSLATSTKSILFGAMNRYIVRRVKEFAIKRLVERYADFDQVGFIGFARYDGELMDAAAVKNLTGHA